MTENNKKNDVGLLVMAPNKNSPSQENWPDLTDHSTESHQLITESDTTFIANNIEEVAQRVKNSQGCRKCRRNKENKNMTPAQIRHHINTFHCRLAVSFVMKDGRKVFCLPCREGCIERGVSAETRSHYHCPICKRIYGRRVTMLKHFQGTCKRSVTPYLLTTKRSTNFKTRIGKETSTPMSRSEAFDQHNKVLHIVENKLKEWLQAKSNQGKLCSIETIQGKSRAFFETTKRELGGRHRKPFFASRHWLMNYLRLNKLEYKQSTPKKLTRKDTTALLIELVKLRPHLFDISEYQVAGEDNIKQTWDTIAVEVGLPSGLSAYKDWKSLEEKYYEQTENWSYKNQMSFLSPLEGSEKNDVISDSPPDFRGFPPPPMPMENVDMPVDSKDGITVLIEGAVDDRRPSSSSSWILENTTPPQHSISDAKKVHLAQLTKISFEMECIQKEHAVKMEILQLKKDILLRKLKTNDNCS